MNIYSIYKATNIINGKVYIGFDSNWPSRISTHKSSSKNINRLFYSAIKKYGWANFTWELIYQSTDGAHTLNVMENYFINEYRSYVGFQDCNGYNLTLGGDGSLGRQESEETRKKKSLSKKGKRRPPISQEQKEKISLAKKGKAWEDMGRTSYTKKDLSSINNPMKDPIKVAKMLATRKRNKELKALNG
jgi:group I intron endonuclease